MWHPSLQLREYVLDVADCIAQKLPAVEEAEDMVREGRVARRCCSPSHACHRVRLAAMSSPLTPLMRSAIPSRILHLHAPLPASPHGPVPPYAWASMLCLPNGREALEAAQAAYVDDLKDEVCFM